MRLSKAIFFMEMRKIIAYRISFWINFLGTSLGQLGISYFLWSSIFEHSGQNLIGEMNFEMMIFYSFLAPMTIKTIFGTQFLNISEDIYSGGLNKFIIYPISYFQFKSVQQFTHVFMHLIQLFAALIVYLIFFRIPENVHINSLSITCFIINIAISALAFGILEAILEVTAFWAENVWSLTILLRFLINLLSGAWLPLSLFPPHYQKYILILPFHGMVYTPVKMLTGDLSLTQWINSIGIMVTWIIFLSFILKFVWSKGNKSYTGIGI